METAQLLNLMFLPDVGAGYASDGHDDTDLVSLDNLAYLPPGGITLCHLLSECLNLTGGHGNQ